MVTIKQENTKNQITILRENNNNFHIHTVHHDIIEVLYSPSNAQVTVLKIILKFTLK